MVAANLAVDKISSEDITHVNQLISEVFYEEEGDRYVDAYVRWKQAVQSIYSLEEKALESPEGDILQLSVVELAHKLLAVSAKLRAHYSTLPQEIQNALETLSISPTTIRAYDTSLKHAITVLETVDSEEAKEIEQLKERIFGGTA